MRQVAGGHGELFGAEEANQFLEAPGRINSMWIVAQSGSCRIGSSQSNAGQLIHA